MYNNNYFPRKKNNELESSEDLSLKVFGNRLYKDQTLYEYLIEFLLVFVSAKKENGDKKFEFHSIDDIEKESSDLKYYSDPKIGFKRYIFFNNAKSENKFDIDKKAYEKIDEIIFNTLDITTPILQKDDAKEIIKDMFYGFSAVLKNRSWFAQSLLPIVPEMILTESIGEKSVRSKYNDFVCKSCSQNKEYASCTDCYESNDKNLNYLKVDKKFAQNRHSFFARGGEVYYLHLLQGLYNNSEKKVELEKKLTGLFNEFPQLSNLSNYIQKNWEDNILSCHNSDEANNLKYKNNLKYISSEFQKRSKDTIDELINLLDSEMDILKKLELISLGMMIQIFRMMHIRVSKDKALWILDFTDKNTKSDVVKKYAISSLKLFEDEIEDSFREIKPDLEINSLKKSRENSINLIRKLGKDIGLIIPFKGPGMRMTLTEDLVRFLVISIIKPGKKLQLNTFIDKLYFKFGIIIDSNKFEKFLELKEIENGKDNKVYFDKNLFEFEKLLKKCGFLRELSDATSIVENPYNKRSL